LASTLDVFLCALFQVIDFIDCYPWFGMGTYLAITIAGSWQYPKSPFLFSQGKGGQVIAIEIGRILIAGPLSGRRAG
jgi:hypothetical protein